MIFTVVTSLPLFISLPQAISLRFWSPLSATSSSTCISLLFSRSSSRVLLYSRSRFLSIGAPMVSFRLKVSSTPLFYGDSRGVVNCSSSTRHFTLYNPPHLELRYVNSNHRSVCFILPLPMSLRLEDPHRRSPSISSQAHSLTTTSDVLTGVSGIPHKTRFIDPNLFQVRIMCSQSLLSITSAADLLREFDETFSTDETSAAGLPPSIIPCTPESRLSTEASLSLDCQHIGLVVVRRRPCLFALELVVVHNVGLASLLGCKDHRVQLISQPSLMWGGLVSLTNPLKMFGGFTGIFTEIISQSLQYFSFSKSLLCLQLLVGSPGSSVSSLHPSSLRSVLPPDVMWRSVSKFITVLLSCVAVRSGPEDATDFVSATIRGADLALTSQFKVTISQVSGFAMNLVSTPPSLTVELLSFYPRSLSSSILYVVMLYAWRVFYYSPFSCILNV